MSYSAPNRLLMPTRNSIDTLTNSSFGPQAAPYPIAWGTANLAIYVPIVVPSPVVVRGLWYGGGDTGGGNVDLGLYTPAGVAVVTATSAAHPAAENFTLLAATATLVQQGLYYIALSSDSATNTIVAFATSGAYSCALGVLTEASAYPLPATATMARLATVPMLPVMGLLLGTVVT